MPTFYRRKAPIFAAMILQYARAVIFLLGVHCMANTNVDQDRADDADQSGENQLRGGALTGSEQKRAVDHTAFEKKRNPDTVIRVDNEEDALYTDGLELEDETPQLVTTPGNDSTR
jgi:hypothetical protein